MYKYVIKYERKKKLTLSAFLISSMTLLTSVVSFLYCSNKYVCLALLII